MHCISCGHEGIGDMKHKFSDYITKEIKKRTKSIEENSIKKKSKKSSTKKDKEEEEEDDPSLFQNSTQDEDVKNRRKLLLGESSASKEKGRSWWEQELKRTLAGNDPISREKLIEFRNKLLWTPDDLTKSMVENCFSENLPKQVLPFAKRFQEYFSEKRTQKALINSMMEIIGNKYAQYTDRIAQIIKAFYDLDCIQEDIILEWYDTTDPSIEKNIERISELKIAMATFATWLKNSKVED